MQRDSSASAEFVTGGKEAFARVTFANELLMFTSKLVPERMEGLVVRPMDDVTQSVEGISEK